ncbi:hypothetical protein [Streptomyces cylindrosporus]|uniref:DUF3592 domain-containing protein n=1 Tax=Streptomyces cylindrosporus TaxID=2927583 RepID=A0ABS9YKU3_9ACTN|nr:hypothetical protein [Streptomyces cylindrosporus]MCI3277888.1 hypothetical protein [Streptomyces cylindrosporus]
MVETLCATLGFLVVTSVPALWLFSRDPESRRQAILAALGFAIVCVVVLVVCQRRAGGWRPFSEVAREETSKLIQGDRQRGGESPELPSTLPSRRCQQQRTLFWGLSLCTAIIGVVALAAGTPQRSALVQRLHDAGAEFSSVRVEKVSDVRQLSRSGKDPYVATVVVQLPDAAAGEFVYATVKTETYDRLYAGDQVEVLYAPTQPRLGAIAGDERKLGPELRGETMPAYLRWGCIVLWVLGALSVLNVVSRKHGFRGFSRMGDGDRAVRGRYVRIGQYHHEGAGGEGEPRNGKYLEIHTDVGRIPFLADVADHGLPEDVLGHEVWLCWDARRGSQGGRFSAERTPAALVFDSGWVIHGMLNVTKAAAFKGAGTSFEKAIPSVEGSPPLRVLDPRSNWLLSMSPLLSSLCVVATVCAALLVLDLDNMWRWVVAVVGLLCLIAAANPHVSLASDSVKLDSQ